ncbi:MAG: hypothetical protein EBU84_09315 [Actinobacteria bacterium]|nr:hypothetical protein [Actinomycetota bacterium]
MTGPKLNEKSFVAGERSGTKASAKYVRSSASKARVVLNLIRDKDVRSADEILAFTDREMAVVVRSHITVVVARLDDDRLQVIQAKADSRGGATARRRARVEESRKRAASKKSEVTEPAEQVEEQEEVTSVNEEVVEAEASEAGEEN